MSRQLASCGLLLLTAALIAAAILGVPDFRLGRQDETVSKSQPVGIRVTTIWESKSHPVTRLMFDRAMDLDSVSSAITVEPAVKLDLRKEGNHLVIEPASPLAPDTHYRFTLAASARDADGTPLDQDRQWGYVTASPIADVTHPVRSGDRSTPLVIQFSTSMDPTSVSQGLRIEPPIAGDRYWSETDTVLMIAPSQPLPAEQAYTVHFDSVLRDAEGNEFPPAEPVKFTTPPAILSVSPQGESLYPGAAIEILFDRPMDAQSTEKAVRIEPEVPGQFAWQSTRLVFDPDTNWDPQSVYTVTVTPSALDQNGHEVLKEPYTWSFNVSETVDVLDAGAPGESACDTSSSMGMDITVRSLMPQRLVAGDRVQIFAVVHNRSSCSRRAYASLDSDALTIEGLRTHTIMLLPGEQRVTSWMATTNEVGGGEAIVQAVSGVDGDVVRTHLDVQPTGSLQQASEPAGNVRICREYRDIESGKSGESVAIGQVVQVRLHIKMPQAAAGIVVEDRPPAGLEPLLPQPATGSHGATTYTVHDDVVRFSLPQMDAGDHVLTYLALATYGGEYTAPPAELFLARGATLWGRSGTDTLTIDASSREGLAKLSAGGGGGGGEEYDPRSTCVGGTDNPNDEPYDAVFFEEYGVNPFVDTDEDNLSTFAVDVDTGSYTIMRYYVQDGHLPPDESVRVEEYINYFDQGYEPPAKGEGAFAIHLDGAPSIFGSEQHQLVRVGLQGYSADPESRPDAVLTFVIDVSGSMNRQDRLELVKQSLKLLVDELRPTDRIGIAVYGTRGRKVLAHTPVSEKDTILDAIDSLQPGGSTYAEEGLRVGYQMAAEAYDPDAINRVILCSDGVANVGKTGHEAILATIETHAEDGIYLTTVGFGMGNYNDVLMEQLADHGDGFYAYVDTIDEARRIFVYELTSTLQVIARDARIQVEFNPAVVRSYRLIGYENRDIADEEFRQDDVDAGEIGVGHSVTALYEIKLWEGGSATDPAMTVYVRYEDPDTGETIEINRSISVAEFAPTFEEASPYFQLTAVIAEYAEVLRHSYWAKDSSLDAVLEQAERVAQYFPEDEEVGEFLSLVKQATSLSDKVDKSDA
jgi:Ca-activated chloride channel family protein